MDGSFVWMRILIWFIISSFASLSTKTELERGMGLNSRQLSRFCFYFIFSAKISRFVNAGSNNSNFISQSNWTLHSEQQMGGAQLPLGSENPLNTIDFINPGGLFSAWFKKLFWFLGKAGFPTWWIILV